MNTCPSFVNFVTRYSKEMTNRLLPVQSPAVCAAIYLHKYKKITDSIAFIGPCIAKKDDFDSPETNGEISYNITFAHLVQALEGIDLSSYSDTFEGRNNTLGSLAPIEGGLKRSISHFIPEKEFIMSVDNGVYYLPYYEYYENQIFKSGNAPFVTDIITCEHGCIEGPGTEILTRII